MNETFKSGIISVILSMELTDILAGFSHDSFCFSVCIHIPILAFLSLSLDTSSSMQAIIVSYLINIQDESG